MGSNPAWAVLMLPGKEEGKCCAQGASRILAVVGGKGAGVTSCPGLIPSLRCAGVEVFTAAWGRVRLG